MIMQMNKMLVTKSYVFCQLIKEFRDDEMEHHDTGLEHDAESVSLNYCHNRMSFMNWNIEIQILNNSNHLNTCFLRATETFLLCHLMLY